MAVAGRKRRVFASTAWWKHIQSASDDELWNLLQNLGRHGSITQSRSAEAVSTKTGELLAAQFHAQFHPPPTRTDRRDFRSSTSF